MVARQPRPRGTCPRAACLRAARPAFTLIELTIVVLLMGIMTAIAAPKYITALAYYRVNSAAGRVAGDLRTIRQYASRTSVVQTVVFDATADTYTVAGMTDEDRRGNAYTFNLMTSDYMSDISSVSFGGSASVQFDIFGRPNAAGTVVVSSGGQSKTVTVDGAGNVSIN